MYQLVERTFVPFFKILNSPIVFALASVLFLSEGCGKQQCTYEQVNHRSSKHLSRAELQKRLTINY